ncbi:ubiquitin-like Rad60 SUMO-like protein [Ceratobasidium sp. AG-Ba]|nr:ubiquitin-like Rad60 SUMO-like protein [Ceratobasidium sp. AG-Ba]QRW10433.1 ubiquitin-like Rad60 SUMO-like protein [Ceratobasidium sp. AG-Ba]
MNPYPPTPRTRPYYVATYQGRSVTIKRDPSYETTINLLKKSFTSLMTPGPETIRILTKMQDYGGLMTEISEDTWPDIVDSLKLVQISLGDRYIVPEVEDPSPQFSPIRLIPVYDNEQVQIVDQQ